MLTQHQQELIHREIDGENSPQESAEVRKLVETQPEALALMTNLRALDALFGEVPDRAPSAHVTQLIHNEIPVRWRASEAGQAHGPTQTITSWAIQQWNAVTNLMGEMMLTKKVLIIGTTAVAAIALIGQAVVGYTPSVFDAGTVGTGDGISGVQAAGRYKGKTLDTALSVEDRPIGGLGIHLVRKLMDEVRYERRNGRNVVVLVKELGLGRE